MTDPQDRRRFLRSLATKAGAAAAINAFPPVIQRALAIPANRATGTINDVEHIVILMQENRSFDHYYGTLNGVRGFADRFPVPVPDAPGISGRTVWVQPNEDAAGTPPAIAPFRLNTVQNFAVMRVEGTPHGWADAQAAWNQGLMNAWPKAKHNHSLGHYAKADLPFQWALCNAFTLCDAYHASSQTGTNTNRLFQWTGTNDPLAQGNGPATYNDYDWFDADPGNNGGYTWTTYPERLEAAGIRWQVYENMLDNFTDNPLAGFKVFRDAWYRKPGHSEVLRQRGVSTRDLDQLRADVLANQLPQVSWIVANAAGSEHPGPSSPAQGADYTRQVLEALVANPEVWSKTVLILNFDENDGFFDHMPPPAVPSYTRWNADPAQARLAGASTVDTTGEYHEVLVPYHNGPEEQALLHHPYGLGPRVPMIVISPWSRGGWVNSQVFDHGSVLRFIEKRFGVVESNISPWRRAVCGDLSSAFNFADPDNTDFFSQLPETLQRAYRAKLHADHTTPPTPETLALPTQTEGVRPSCALPYALEASARVDGKKLTLKFTNSGAAGAVFHVYNRLDLNALPRRYTAGAGQQLEGSWSLAAGGAYDLWVLGPNGFHRHVAGAATQGTRRAQPEIELSADAQAGELRLKLLNRGDAACTFTLRANAYDSRPPARYAVAARSETIVVLPLHETQFWYDYSVSVLASFMRRFAGRLETGLPSITDPAMFGRAVGTQTRL